MNLPRLKALLLACALLASPAAWADWPERPIRMLVGIAPGGAVDIVARTVARHMTGTLGQPVVVENRAGASGGIAAQQFATMPADGYTLLFGLITYAILPHAQKTGWDPLRDMLPLSQMTKVPVVLVTPAASPYKTFDDLITAARKEPGKLNFSTGGMGTTTHLAGEVLMQHAGTKATFVHYRGGNPAMMALVGGEVDAMFDNPQAATFAYQKEGRIRILAAMQSTRLPSLPDVPTITELGFPAEASVTSWHGLFGRPGMPDEARDKIVAAVQAALKDPEVRQTFLNMGLEIVGDDPVSFDRFFRDEYQRWGKLLKETGIQLQ